MKKTSKKSGFSQTKTNTKPSGANTSTKEKSASVLNVVTALAIIALVIFIFQLPSRCERNNHRATISYEPHIITQTISPSNDWIWISFSGAKGSRKVKITTPDNEVKLFVKGSTSGKVVEPFKEKSCVTNPQDTGVYVKVSKQAEFTFLLEH